MANRSGCRGPVPGDQKPPTGPSSVTSVTDDSLKLWADNIDVSYAVVLVLRDANASPPDSPEFADLKQIPYQLGMFKANLTGAELLRLAAREEVESITPDEEATAL